MHPNYRFRTSIFGRKILMDISCRVQVHVPAFSARKHFHPIIFGQPGLTGPLFFVLGMRERDGQLTTLALKIRK
jgi:hypothetical protein